MDSMCGGKKGRGEKRRGGVEGKLKDRSERGEVWESHLSKIDVNVNTVEMPCYSRPELGIAYSVIGVSCRQFVISHLFHLEHLDDSPVTNEERETAAKIYGRRQLSTLSTPSKNPSSQVHVGDIRQCPGAHYQD